MAKKRRVLNIAIIFFRSLNLSFKAVAADFPLYSTLQVRRRRRRLSDCLAIQVSSMVAEEKLVV